MERKMMKSFFAGIMIGLANVIPGVSGGTMAVSMGVYDKLIHCLTHLLKEFKKSVLYLIPIILGAGVALVGSSFVIGPMFEKFPLQTNLLFIGLILGGLPAVFKKVKGNSVKVSHVLAFILFFVLVVGMAVLGDVQGSDADLSFSFLNVIKLFGIGIIASATMVIPGVSGSMILLLLGYYEPIINTIKNFFTALAAFDMPGILAGMGVLVPAGIGMVFGVFAIAKLIEIVFEKFPMCAYLAILGLIVASPIAILIAGELGTITITAVVTGVAACAAGALVAWKLGGE